MRLTELGMGQSGVVVGMNEGRPTLNRLMEMGLIPGTRVWLVRRAPFGDPLVILLRGYELAVRRAEAREIWVDAR